MPLPVSDDNSSVYSLLGHPPTESERDFVSGDADDGPSNYPSTASKILSPSHPSPPNTSQEEYISLEVAKYEDPKRKYYRKQWPEGLWERGNNGKMKLVELDKLNGRLYALTFGPQNISPMAQKISKKRISLNYNHYKRSLCEKGDMSLHIMMVGYQCPTVSELMANLLAKYISLAANDCGYGNKAEELINNFLITHGF